MGDARANLQLFPGDRLVVGRNEVVKKTVELDRLAEPLYLVWNELITASNAMRPQLERDELPNRAERRTAPFPRRRPEPGRRKGLPILLSRPPSARAASDAVGRLLVEATGPKGARLDEKTFREAMIHLLALPEEAKKPEEAKEKPAKPPEPPGPLRRWFRSDGWSLSTGSRRPAQDASVPSVFRRNPDRVRERQVRLMRSDESIRALEETGRSDFSQA